MSDFYSSWKNFVLSKAVKNKSFIVLFFYHMFFIVFAYYYRINRGISDSRYYWAQNFDINRHKWSDFAHYGTEILLLLNYPLIKLGVPYWFGFFIYGTIGFLGILKWIKWAECVFGEQLYIKKINILWVLFYLPNLHFWTSTLGKEPLIFWGLATVFYSFAKKEYYSFSFFVAILLIFLIRPHVGLMLFLSILFVLLLDSKITLNKKLLFIGSATPFFFILVYMVFKLSRIYYFDYKRIVFFNEFSILSFSDSGSYVPMLDYGCFYKLFSFYFRPLFYDHGNLFIKLASIENLIILILFFTSIYSVLRYKIRFWIYDWINMALLYTVISGVIYIQRYANLGIFMRTKIMYAPFIIIGLLFLIKNGINTQKNQHS